MEIINFAHGELLMLGAFAMCFALPVLGLLYWPAMAAAISHHAGGFVVYEICCRRLRPDEFERAILITLGLSIILIHVDAVPLHRRRALVDTQYGFEGLRSARSASPGRA
jgi:branched-chain amino acid transport system permease protein